MKNVQLDMVGANNGIHDHLMLEAPDLDPGISRGALSDIQGSECGWDMASEGFNQFNGGNFCWGR